MVFVDKLRRSTSIAAAALLLVATMVPLLASQTASAYTILGDREIRMSTSEGGAEEVSYRVDFEVPNTDDIGGVVVAFCAETPIIGDSDCTVPAGFSLSGASVDHTEPSDVDLSGFTAAFTNESTGGAEENTVTLTNATPENATGAGDSVVFTIEDVDNPTAIETFYARIMVYETDTAANAYSVADVNNPNFAGGIALSTAELITIEAKVQERLTFCILTDALVFDPDPQLDDYNTCSGFSSDPVILGDDNGVLDSTNPSISKDAKFNITTNASAGATVRMKGETLTSGSFSIDAIGDTDTASAPGTEQFGLCVYTHPDSRDTGGLSAITPYDHADCDGTSQGQGNGFDNGALFAFDTGETLATYGSPIALKNAGEFSTGVLVFLGNISNTTEPGIYTTTLDFIATGRY